MQAQIYDAESCGTHEGFSVDASSKPWKGDNEFLYRYLEKIGYDENKQQVFFRVPVKFWVYRLSNGTGGVSERFLRDQIRLLNYYYSTNNTGIRFYMHPEVEYIDNDRLYVLRYMTSGFLQALRPRENGCVNVLIASNLIRKRRGSRPGEYHGVHNSISKNIIIRHKIAGQTLSHEIGHFFGLKHPHEHWKRGKLKQEAVDRGRKHPGLFKSGRVCEYNGDKLCDTPAEPNMARYTDDSCRYVNYTLTDNWGDRYRPDTDNIMSYASNRECRINFTKGQIAVMLYTAEMDKHSAYWDVQKNPNSYFDHNEPNNSQETAAEISLNTPHGNTFHLVKTHRKGRICYDDADWFYFEIKSKKAIDYRIIIEKGQFPMPKDMAVSVYQEDSFINSFNISNVQRKSLNLNKLGAGRYYIRVSDNRPANHLRGYIIGVSQNGVDYD